MPDFALALIVKSVVALARLGGLVLVARHFGGGGKGVITEALLPATTLVMVFKLGIDYASVMILKRHKDSEDRLLGAILSFTLLAAALVTVLVSPLCQALWTGLSDLFPPYMMPFVTVALWLFPAQMFHDACLNALLGKVGYRDFSLVKLIQPIVFIALLVSLWGWDVFHGTDLFRTMTVLLSYPISFAVAGLVMFFRLIRHLPVRLAGSFASLGQLVVLGGVIQVVALLIYFNRRVDVWMITWLMDPEDNGIYSVVVSMLEFGLFVAQPLSSLVLVRTAGDEDPGSAARILRFSLAVSTVYLIVLCLCARWFLSLAGPDFPDPGWRPLLFLAPGILVFNVHQILSQVLYGRGEGRRLLGLMISALAFNVALNWILIRELPEDWRLVGVACASSLSYLMIAVGVLTLVSRRLEMTWCEMLLPQRGDVVKVLSKFRSASS